MSARAPDGEMIAIAVAPIREPGLDLDAGADVTRAVRLAVARAAGFRLVEESDADRVLHVELLDVNSALAPFAEPSLRAAQYVVRLTLRGTLQDEHGRWTSPAVVGEGRFLSTPGGVEQLDGANRRALERAAQQAAERLVGTLRFRVEQRALTTTSTSP